jgi:hypothetical protein
MNISLDTLPLSNTRYELPPGGISLLGYIVRRMHKTALLLPVGDMAAQGRYTEALAQVAMYATAASVSYGPAYYQPSFDRAGSSVSEADPATDVIVTASLESASPHYCISYSVKIPAIGGFSGTEKITGTTVSWYGLGMPAPSRFSFNDLAGAYSVQMVGLITSELLPGLFSHSRIRAHGTLDLQDSAGNIGTLKVMRSGEMHIAVTAPNGNAIVRHEQLARPARQP